uniref:Protein arginine N-methyltransferase domain-containing protein n=1 Tax=Oryza glumipatula TaxID=40148 RepID=A0A0E0A3X1_9ORYZ
MPSCCCLLGLGFPSPPSALRILRRRMASRAFQLRLNPLTGDSEWLVVEEEEEEDHHPTPPPKQLLATTSYLDMLNDSARNRAYRRAIEAAVTDPSSRVLDIGAGTGLLSMMAARALAAVGGETRGGSVSACESYLPMGKLMRRVLRANGMENRVKVFHKRSDELKVGDDLDSPADILVSEILDSELLGEGLIPTLQQAYDMLLAKNPKIVPYRATTYGQLVESTFLWKLHDLHNNEANAADGVWLTPGEMERIVSVKPQQHAMQCDALEDEIRLNPSKFLNLTFGNGQIVIVRPISRYEQHEMDMFMLLFHGGYFNWILLGQSSTQLLLDGRDNQVVRGRNADWCDHWKQCVWFMQGKGIPATEDQVLSLRARHNQTSISYQLNINDEACDRSFKGDHLTLLPERIALYGDKDWRSALINTIKNALTVKSSPTCVVADDSLFLALLISSMSPTSKVIAMYPGLRDKGAAYLRSVADANNFSIDQIQVIGKRASSITADDLKHKKVNLLVGEPFYLGSEGMLPWQNLRFWSVRTLLDSMLSEDAFIMPCKGILKLCAMSLPDLWRSRSSLKDVEGFDHSVVNETLGACGYLPGDQQGPCLPYYVWQCGYTKKLSKVYSLMDFNFSEPIHSCFGKTKIEFSHDGTCHGFAVWIDWVLDERKSVVLTTGPDNRYWKQGVQLFSKPVEVNPGKSVMHVEASFDPSTGEITFSSSSTTCS